MSRDFMPCIERAALGDQPALAALLHEFGQEVRADLAGRFPDRHRSVASVEDVLQVTFADAFLSIRGKSFPRPADFVAWLKRIGRNNLHDLIRMLDAPIRGGDLRQLPLDPLVESQSFVQELLTTQSQTPSRFMHAEESHAALQRALAALPDDYQRVVRAVYFEQQPVSAVAEEIGRSAGATHMLLARALAALRRVLEAFFTNSAPPA